MSDDARIVRIETAGGGYDVVIGPSALRTLGERLHAVTDAGRVALVADDTAWSHYGERTFSSLLGAGFRVSPVTVPAGEGSKSWDQAGAVLERLATAGVGRGDIVLALGGGVVGDLAGFCAAVYMRGVAFAQVPTTLLAQVDSSVGGKTGVDLAAGKNLAGAFWQPALVVADTSTLETLPAGEWRSGLAEIAKAALLAGGEDIEWLEENAERLAEADPQVVPEAIERAVAFKAGVVAADERESGLRECLNLGHTLGHALEVSAGYGALRHGEAVAEGMRFAARLAEDRFGAAPGLRERQERLLDRLGLGPLAVAPDAQELLRAMEIDKKVRDGEVRFVLMRGIGEFECVPVPAHVLRTAVERYASGER